MQTLDQRAGHRRGGLPELADRRFKISAKNCAIKKLIKNWSHFRRFRWRDSQKSRMLKASMDGALAEANKRTSERSD